MIKQFLGWVETKAAIYIIVAVAGYIFYLQRQINQGKETLEKQQQQFAATVEKMNRQQVDDFTNILGVTVENMKASVYRTDSALIETMKQYMPEKTKQLDKTLSTWQQRFQRSR